MIDFLDLGDAYDGIGEFGDDVDYGADLDGGGGDFDAITELPEDNPLVASALKSAEISRIPPPCAVVDVPRLNNSLMRHGNTIDFNDDIRTGDSVRVQEQEIKYGEGGSLPASLHEDAHRLPRIRELGRQYGPRVNKSLCDIRSGMLSGWSGAPRGAFRGEIGPTEGGPRHPDGQDRVPFFEEAYDLAANDPLKRSFIRMIILC